MTKTLRRKVTVPVLSLPKVSAAVAAEEGMFSAISNVADIVAHRRQQLQKKEIVAEDVSGGPVTRRAPACLLDRYQFTNCVLGQGAYATVHEAVCKRHGHRVAVKEFFAQDDDDDDNDGDDAFPSEDFERETAALRALADATGIVCMRAAYADVFGRRSWMVLDRADVTLQDWLSHAVRKQRQRAAWSLTAQLAAALTSVHAAGFAHRDLKPQNVLLSLPSGDGGGGVLRLADFGLARNMSGCEHAATPRVVTMPYRAPELLCMQFFGLNHGFQHACCPKGTPYNGQAVDVWAFGCIAYQLHISGQDTLFVIGKGPGSAMFGRDSDDDDDDDDDRYAKNCDGELYTLRHIARLVGALPPLAADQYVASCACNVCKLQREFLHKQSAAAAAVDLPQRLQENSWTVSNFSRRHGTRVVELLGACLQADPAARETASQLCNRAVQL